MITSDNKVVGGDGDDDDYNNAVSGEHPEGDENYADSGWLCACKEVVTMMMMKLAKTVLKVTIMNQEDSVLHDG